MVLSTQSCFTFRLTLGPLLASLHGTLTLTLLTFLGTSYMVCCRYISSFTNSPEIKAGCISEQRAKPLGLIFSTGPPTPLN